MSSKVVKALALTNYRNLLVHTSTANIGGGELSLLALFDANQIVPLFIVPGEGALSEAIQSRGWQFVVLPWPKGLELHTQRSWMTLPFKIFGMIGYELKLISLIKHRNTRDLTLWSSGIKSHFFCLWLSPWLRTHLLFDIRDFIRPRLVRNLIACASKWFGCEIHANSKVVASDYVSAQVFYPIVSGFANGKQRVGAAKFPKRDLDKKIITHLAYFAPYKGQHLFLDCARALLDQGVVAEFWIVGEVIYPAKKYVQYREALLKQVERLKLGHQVKFLGKLPKREDVADVLAKTDLLLHSTIEPEPYGRSVMEALQSGCDVICHKGSGVCETAEIQSAFPSWTRGLEKILGPTYVSLKASQ